MKKVRGHARLFRRVATYYHRAAIPQDIKGTYPKTEETFSLKTKDPAEARRLVRIAAVEVDRRFEAHRRELKLAKQPPLKELSDQQIKHVGEVYFAYLEAELVSCKVADHDSQSRPIAICATGDIPDIGRAMIADGYGFVDRILTASHSLGTAYDRAERTARANGAGFWAVPKAEPIQLLPIEIARAPADWLTIISVFLAAGLGATIASLTTFQALKITMKEGKEQQERDHDRSHERDLDARARRDMALVRILGPELQGMSSALRVVIRLMRPQQNGPRSNWYSVNEIYSAIATSVYRENTTGVGALKSASDISEAYRSWDLTLKLVGVFASRTAEEPSGDTSAAVDRLLGTLNRVQVALAAVEAVEEGDMDADGSDAAQWTLDDPRLQPRNPPDLNSGEQEDGNINDPENPDS